MILVSRFVAVLLFGIVQTGGGHAATVTNTDVIRLLEAGMPEEVVLEAIRVGEPRFDTASAALIELKNKGATPGIIKAVLGVRSDPGSPSVGDNSPASGGFSQEDVVALDNDREIAMQYRMASMRYGMRAFGFGGAAGYQVLSGDRAERRLSTTPQFLIALPKNEQAVTMLTLASLAARNNQTREVLVANMAPMGSMVMGIHRDRVVKIVVEPHADQGRSPNGAVLYRVRPEQPLSSGEYAIVVRQSKFYDFGVD